MRWYICLGHVRRSREQWLALFQEFERSELIASEFCRERNICQRYFSKRKIQLGFGVQPVEPVKKLVKMNRAVPSDGSAAVIMLIHGDTKVSIPSSQSTDWVASLVKALAQ